MLKAEKGKSYRVLFRRLEAPGCWFTDGQACSRLDEAVSRAIELLRSRMTERLCICYRGAVETEPVPLAVIEDAAAPLAAPVELFARYESGYEPVRTSRQSWIVDEIKSRLESIGR